MQIGATWRTRLNRPCTAAMRPYVKLVWPLVSITAPLQRRLALYAQHVSAQSYGPPSVVAKIAGISTIGSVTWKALKTTADAVHIKDIRSNIFGSYSTDILRAKQRFVDAPVSQSTAAVHTPYTSVHFRGSGGGGPRRDGTPESNACSSWTVAEVTSITTAWAYARYVRFSKRT